MQRYKIIHIFVFVSNSNMVQISSRTQQLPASAIRKLVPFADAAKAAGVTVYHLNVGAPDIKSPDCALDSIKKINLDHVSYTNSAGFLELRRDMIEKYYKKIGIDVGIDEIIINVAGSEAVEFAIQITCDEGDEILLIEPYYTNYYTLAFKHNVKVNVVRTSIREGFRVPGIEEFEKVLTPRTKAVMISNPGNPTGVVYSKEEMELLGQFCLKHNLFLISDEVYREFCYTAEPHYSAMNLKGLEQNVILVDSVSKRYNLCGCRIGCTISHNKDVMAAVMKLAQARLCPPVLGQYASLGALDTPQEYFDQTREEYIARRDCAIEGLNKIPGVFTPKPDGAFYTIAELPVDDAEAFAKWLLTEFRLDGETVMVTPAAAFYLDKSLGKRQVRIAYVLEVPKLKRALHVLEKALEAYPNKL